MRQLIDKAVLIPAVEGETFEEFRVRREKYLEDANNDGQDLGTVTFNGGTFSVGGGVAFFTSEKFALETVLKFTGGTFDEVDVGDATLRNLDIEASSFRFKIGISWWP